MADASNLCARLRSFHSKIMNDAADEIDRLRLGQPLYSRQELMSQNAELVKALETAAARFNMMAGVGLVNGADPKTGYQECMDVLNRLVGNQREGS